MTAPWDRNPRGLSVIRFRLPTFAALSHSITSGIRESSSVGTSPATRRAES
jgi:hypothetical protein